MFDKCHDKALPLSCGDAREIGDDPREWNVTENHEWRNDKVICLTEDKYMRKENIDYRHFLQGNALNWLVMNNVKPFNKQLDRI